MGAPSPALGTVKNVLSDPRFKFQEDTHKILNYTPPKNYSQLFPCDMSGRARDGCPIVIIPLGKWNIRSIMEKGEKEQFELYWLNILANLSQKVNEVGKTVWIVDLNGFNINQIASLAYCQFCINAAKHFTSTYPDLLDTLNYINVPRAFSILFSMLKPFWTTEILSRIKIYTPADQEKFKEEILKKISPDQLPVPLGGTQTNTNICKYLEVDCARAGTSTTLQRHVTEDGIEMVTVEISPGQKYKLDLEITKPNTNIQWNFKSERQAIGFLILYNSCDEIFPRINCESNNSSQVGSISCEKSGTYTLVFDNKSNQLQMETLHFIVGVFE